MLVLRVAGTGAMRGELVGVCSALLGVNSEAGIKRQILLRKGAKPQRRKKNIQSLIQFILPVFAGFQPYAYAFGG